MLISKVGSGPTSHIVVSLLQQDSRTSMRLQPHGSSDYLSCRAFRDGVQLVSVNTGVARTHESN
jgi:hypothetical protein